MPTWPRAAADRRGLDALSARPAGGALGSDVRMARLLLAIAYENISTGIAGAAFVAYVSGDRQQELHRGAICAAVVADLPDRLAGPRHRGEAVRPATAMRRVPLTAAAGVFAILFVLLEWWRVARSAARNAPTRRLGRSAGLTMIAYLAIIAVQVFCVVDVIRNRRNSLWIMALIFLPVASTIAYFIVEVMPRMQHNRHVRDARQAIAVKFDPERELRAARARSTSPTRQPIGCVSPTP